ncbi:hypothetical protein [Acetivibrio clariflavus]|uniref:Lipoprotein n=1 Tax=Acetivibrio clariflavus (strain DSM 19732 / NBRC 101661 / EBR45) TaxID=720554 RepID=G8M174_ACECE|nr:hypothetical protein [Acetivibrio clariflavus]AEV68050.1 hypothetical protein Clocl_1399 [Acetivibrio clariflavus DSM 19732]
MNRKFKFIAIISMITIMISSSGCSILFKKQEPIPEENNKIETPETSVEEDKKVLEMLSKYFEEIYSQPIETYNQNVATGNPPEKIKQFIAKRTLDEGSGNPEIGIHLPRVVEINGLTMVDYEILRDSSDKPIIESGFIGKTGENFLYFVKLNLKAKALENALFDMYYTRNSHTKIYEKTSEPNGDLYEYIKVQAKYDVEVTRQDGEYKIVTVKEANYKPGVENRLFKLNNEFLTKLNYLDEKVEEEKKVLEAEKALIEGFFNNLIKLDKERMILLKSKWQAGSNEFIDFLKLVDAFKVNDKDSMYIDQNYIKNFNYDALPLQINMEKINSLKNMEIIEHPGYTSKKKRYLVSFDASVLQSNGMVGEEQTYHYDYYVTLKVANDNLYVESIKLNEYYKGKKKSSSSQTKSNNNENKTSGNEAKSN